MLSDPDGIELELRPRAHQSDRSSRPTAYGISSSASAWYWYTGAAGAVLPSRLWFSRARQPGRASGSRVVRSEIRSKEPATASIASGRSARAPPSTRAG
ncbi:hypothetical protein ACWFQ8_03730 [Streptomyces sp. NPDC055254]